MVALETVQRVAPAASRPATGRAMRPRGTGAARCLYSRLFSQMPVFALGLFDDCHNSVPLHTLVVVPDEDPLHVEVTTGPRPVRAARIALTLGRLLLTPLLSRRVSQLLELGASLSSTSRLPSLLQRMWPRLASRQEPLTQNACMHRSCRQETALMHTRIGANAPSNLIERDRTRSNWWSRVLLRALWTNLTGTGHPTAQMGTMCLHRSYPRLRNQLQPLKLLKSPAKL